jgi:DNA-binding CsgD family transcriptional regulator
VLQFERATGKPALPILEGTSDNPSAYSALIVVDAEAQIKFSFWDGSDGQDAKELLCEPNGSRLLGWLEVLVRSLIEDARAPDFKSYVVLRDAGRTLRLLPLAGLEGTLFGLVMEADLDHTAIARAAGRFHLTRRQTEVLVLVLGGASASDVARSLVISEYTAQGYVKSLLAKTGARNRAAMVAKVLNWKQPVHSVHAPTPHLRKTVNL